jgi:putative membrane protein
VAGDLEEEKEPDYRMRRAAVGPYRATAPTSLALLAAGVAVVGVLPDVGHEALRRVMGLVLVATGLLVTATARLRWRAVDQAMRHGRPLPRAPVTTVLTAGTLVAAVLAVVLVLLV